MGILDGKVAVITGGGHGLGRAYAQLFAREGAGVVVNDLGVGLLGDSASSDSAEETVELVKKAGGDAVAHFGDCSDWNAGKEMIDLALDRFGRIDILVNNAGILRDRMIFNISEAEWDDVIRVHLKGHFCPTRHAAEYWRNEAKAGRPVAGRIINTTSAAGLWGNAGQPNYAAAKAGIVGFTLALAHSMARYGVTANVVGPAAETNPEVAIDGAPPELREAMSAEQVAPVVAYLASDRAAHISGQIFHVAGGRVDRVDGYQLVKGVFKAGSPWTVDELAEVFDEQVAGENPAPVQLILLELTQSIVGAGSSS
jgi:NAD(P)-dependent dehydrogenase (short-subunit alcohol dehydrogenase family)